MNEEISADLLKEIEIATQIKSIREEKTLIANEKDKIFVDLYRKGLLVLLLP